MRVPGSHDARIGTAFALGLAFSTAAVLYGPYRFRRWDGSFDREGAVDALVGGSGGDAAMTRIREHLELVIPDAVLRRLAERGFRVDVNETPRDGEWGVGAEYDYHGGFMSYSRRLIVVSEKIRDPRGGWWYPNPQFDYALDHEIGHALSYEIGGGTSGTQDPVFGAAWDADVREIPADLMTSYEHDGEFNVLRYFTYADARGTARAREETFAECFQVELRRSSGRDFELFHKRFPRSLAATRAIVERAFGPVFPPEETP